MAAATAATATSHDIFFWRERLLLRLFFSESKPTECPRMRALSRFARAVAPPFKGFRRRTLSNKSGTPYRNGKRVFKRPKRFYEAPDGFEYVFGTNPVLNALTAGRRKHEALYVREGASPTSKKDAGAHGAIFEAATANGVDTVTASRHDLSQMSGGRVHQDFVLMSTPLAPTVVPNDCMLLPPARADIDHPAARVLGGAGGHLFADKTLVTSGQSELPPLQNVSPSRPPGLWLALHEVSDAGNFGAILRSCLFLGIDGVVVTSYNSAPLSGAVSKASAGAMELTRVYSTDSIARFIKNCRLAGWTVVGTGLSDGSVPLAQLVSGEAANNAQSVASSPVLLVLGSEGTGVPEYILNACDVVTRVEPGMGGGLRPGVTGNVDSLNVSATAAVAMYEILRAQTAALE